MPLFKWNSAFLKTTGTDIFIKLHCCLLISQSDFPYFVRGVDRDIDTIQYVIKIGLTSWTLPAKIFRENVAFLTCLWFACVCLGVFRALRTIYDKEGPLGYYRGMEDLKNSLCFHLFQIPSGELLTKQTDVKGMGLCLLNKILQRFQNFMYLRQKYARACFVPVFIILCV